MNKEITDEELVKKIYEYVGQHIELPDYTILNITTYIQDDKIINIIKYTKDNQIYSKKVETIWNNKDGE